MSGGSLLKLVRWLCHKCLQPLHADGLGGAEFLGEDLHAVFFEKPAESLVIGFGDFLRPGGEVGDEPGFVGILGGVVLPAFIANLHGFQIARQMLELVMRRLREEIVGNEALEVRFEAGIAFRQSEQSRAQFVNLCEQVFYAMCDRRKIAAEGFAERDETSFSKRKKRLQSKQVREDMLVRVLLELIGAAFGRGGGELR